MDSRKCFQYHILFCLKNNVYYNASFISYYLECIHIYDYFGLMNMCLNAQYLYRHFFTETVNERSKKYFSSSIEKYFIFEIYIF